MRSWWHLWLNAFRARLYFHLAWVFSGVCSHWNEKACIHKIVWKFGTSIHVFFGCFRYETVDSQSEYVRIVASLCHGVGWDQIGKRVSLVVVAVAIYFIWGLESIFGVMVRLEVEMMNEGPAEMKGALMQLLDQESEESSSSCGSALTCSCV